ncbi:hypothetical protein ETAA8_37850 [Anatilimnocola aggregata]|uniref:DUF2997 domain-containing protein n=1 Tax=Anatilimnocola aggregata TaxID=2528021 RepID=A0A517YEV2_9BACT|nr:DUF2997 domain-containing protein [Anatilimnocola aggregata]QDU28682.1 hypothetical protein ETAA8_37850 [Anatilimnocola aggregata]
MSKTIEVIVAPDGKVTVQTKGFAGTGCKAASEALEKALGLKQSEQLTAEFFSQPITHQQATEGRA